MFGFNDTVILLTGGLWHDHWKQCVWFVAGQGVGIGNYGGAVQQALLNQAFPDGFVFWGGQTIPGMFNQTH